MWCFNTTNKNQKIINHEAIYRQTDGRKTPLPVEDRAKHKTQLETRSVSKKGLMPCINVGYV